MLVNADFSRRAIVMPHQYQWVASPQAGVHRVMLDRLGGEDARATSIVRYAPGSHFPRHLHPDGEEILVLAGTLSEGHAQYPAGWYLRNPPGSSHAPASPDGAILFVKLRQMTSHDAQTVRIDTGDPHRWQPRADGDICQLYDNGVERVWLQRLKPGCMLRIDGGIELLVLEGEAIFEGDHHPRGTWMRFPPSDRGTVATGTDGATLYSKSERKYHA
nr:cupin domain-containing protein [uncultured Cupriavidus sp.]